MKKEKITYVDDGRTVADMSHVGRKVEFSRTGTTSSVRDIWQTYWAAVRMMFRPMLVVVGFLLAIFGIVTLLFWLM